MPRKLISSGSPFEQKIGYSRAVVDGRWVFVSGTTGFDYAKMAISPDVVEQAEQCFRNIAQVLEAGATCVAVVRAICNTADPESTARALKQMLVQSYRPISTPSL